ncbi:tetratricopeptide repeat protein [uncultured Sunxiuqinia sp.]|uniref:tetratricopeptide repeat protein n=1 Tax=uncultured Sunxiuqinia sp. TaxID=1573825 RepID=UPI00263503BA|nr:tetratricopeptide repeat protein [uncultured Sunxiuqinia sp.]
MFRKSVFLLLLLLPFFGKAQKIDILLLNQKYPQALETIDAALSEKPTAELYFKKSMVHQRLMDYPAALADLNAALKLDSLNVTYLRGRADLFQAMGNNTRAVTDFQKALTIAPDDLLLKYELGKAFLFLNDYSQAFQVFEEIQAVDSTNVMFNKYSALAASKAGRKKRAMHLYEKYLIQNPDDLSAYLNLAAIYEKANQPNKCMNLLAMAHYRFPDSRAIHLKRANTAFVNKKYPIAQHVYQSFMARHDTTLSVYLNYGICLYHNKHTEHALEVLEACYAESPSDVYINFYLGVAHKRLDHYELAANYLDFAIFISIPEFHPEMYHHLAQVYGSQREFEKSIACYERAYELDSRKVEVLFEIATTYEEFNFNKTLALNYYQSYLKEAGEEAENAYYALDRIKRIKEDLFFEK